MLEIIEASESDFPLIEKLAHQIWPPTFSEILSREQMTYMLDMMYSQTSLQKQKKEGVQFVIANENDRAVGYAGFQCHYDNIKTKIHKLYLLPETQGKGYGKRLINYIAQIASEHNDGALTLNVNRFNKAYDFYLKTGFVKIGEENIDIGNGFLMEDAIMEKIL